MLVCEYIIDLPVLCALLLIIGDPTAHETIVKIWKAFAAAFIDVD